MRRLKNSQFVITQDVFLHNPSTFHFCHGSKQEITHHVFVTFEFRPDDDDESGKPHTRSNNNKFKANKKSSTKKKRPIKKNESDEDDSSASPEDLPSSEVKVQGRAELMEMEDDDALEEKALEDLVKEDPGDIAYALADMKRRDNLKLRINNGDFKHLMSEEDSSAEFGYLPGFDQISYDRNFNRLQKSLREGRSLRRSSSLRNSRAIQEGFVQRKKRELQQVRQLVQTKCNFD